jgi:UDP-N-acetylmuramate--alanine ligase
MSSAAASSDSPPSPPRAPRQAAERGAPQRRVGGTSGKSTVTGMIGWILHACHRQPTVMNGAVMKNFVTPSAPFASALVGDPELFVSEVDESDGSIALYEPEIAVLTNISLDHKEMVELRGLFAGFLAAARKAVSTSTTRKPGRSPNRCRRTGWSATASTRRGRFRRPQPRASAERSHASTSIMAAIARQCGCAPRTPQCVECSRRDRSRRGSWASPVADAAAALERFEGLRRRLETVGEAGGVTVIDDFAHNPDKIDATWRRLRAHPGRLLILFQPHGYGPIAKMGEQLAESFAHGMGRDDRLYLADPVYQGGTVDRRAADRTGLPSRSAQGAQRPSISPTARRSATCSFRRPGRATESSSWARATTR